MIKVVGQSSVWTGLAAETGLASFGHVGASLCVTSVLVRGRCHFFLSEWRVGVDSSYSIPTEYVNAVPGLHNMNMKMW